MGIEGLIFRKLNYLIGLGVSNLKLKIFGGIIVARKYNKVSCKVEI